MKITKVQFVFILFLLPLVAVGQDKINYLEFPKNSISIAPTNIFFDGNGNTIFYKRRILQTEDKLKYLRLGTEFFGSFRNGEEDGSYSYSMNIGIEKLRKKQNFSLSFGYELGFVYYSVAGRHAEPGVNAIFAPQAITSGLSGSNIQRGSFFLSSVIGFIGFKYHVSKHFSIGIESGAGLGYYRSTDKLNDDTKETSSGFINDIDPSRQFTLEYYF